MGFFVKNYIVAAITGEFFLYIFYIIYILYIYSYHWTVDTAVLIKMRVILTG